MNDNRYPVSKKMCDKCVSCTQMSKTISGESLKAQDIYFKCIVMMEEECSRPENHIR